MLLTVIPSILDAHRKESVPLLTARLGDKSPEARQRMAAAPWNTLKPIGST